MGGNVNQAFVTEIPACEKPFVANEEAPQSCFQGKFGEEMGSDEFGAIIFIHAKEINKHLLTARISYTEFNTVGQAFRVGRYPIHFHINGNVTGSYVRGNAIHQSFNRACTIHAVNHLLVEHNVVFNIKGLSFFVEDGIEEDNILQYNLAVFTRQSNSLLNPDIQPGSFWIVNPNNIIQHNAVAGSTHFGFWYRVLKNPDGPSRRASVPCSAGSQCTSSATRSQTWAALGCATTSTPSLGRATRASLTTPTRTARGATRTVGSASRTRSLDQTRRREAAAKQGRTRSTARPSKEIASISATVIPTPLARRRPTWASSDSTGSASATRDTLETESNAWTAMATSVPNLANKLR